MEPQNTESGLPGQQPAVPMDQSVPAGVPTVDPATGQVSTQPVGMTSPSNPGVSQTGVGPTTTQAVAGPAMAPSQAPSTGDPTLPMPQQPFVGGAAAPTPATPKRGKGMIMALLAVVLLVLLGGGYVYAFYLPNRPSAVYSDSLRRSGDAVDSLINYASSVSKKNYKSYSLNGTMQVKSSDFSFDATLDGAIDNNANATATLKADVMGQKVTADLRSVHAVGVTAPDLYLRIGGIKSTLDSLGMNSLDSLDGQWLSMDHTLIDTFAADMGHSAASDALGASSTPTQAQLEDAVAKIQAVNKQYLFTSDASKAVLINPDYLGQVTKDGRKTYHYKASYDKAHLAAYCQAVGAALDNSKLNDWSKSANGGKKVSEVINIQSIADSVKNGKANYGIEVWMDTDTKLVHSIQFTNMADSSDMFSVTQGYSGGSVYPFTLTYSGKDNATGKLDVGTLGVSIDTAKNTLSGTLKDAEGTDEANASFTLTPSTSPLSVTAPTGATSITDLFTQLFGSANAFANGDTTGTSQLMGL